MRSRRLSTHQKHAEATPRFTETGPFQAVAADRLPAVDSLSAGELAALLDDEHSLLLMVELSRYPEVVENAGQLLEPHLVAQYLRELAYAFHTWYHEVKALVEDADTRDARLALACAARQVLANGLELLGVSAPEKM